VNRAEVIGRLGKDADFRYLPNGTGMCRFSVAVDRRKRKREDKSFTDWLDVVVWGKAAERASQLVKGDKVFVQGSIQVRKFEENTGVSRRVTEISAYSIELIKYLGMPETQNYEQYDNGNGYEEDSSPDYSI